MLGFLEAMTWIRAPLLWLFLGILLAFLATRVVTRRIRTGSKGLKNWSAGGIHIHHQVFGIALLLIAGCLEFAYRPVAPWSDVLALLFGIGVALTLDEFALWIYMDDVYWREEGRISLDAIFVALAIAGLLLLGVSPLSLDTSSLGAGGVEILLVKAAFVVCGLVPCVVAAVKGKPIAAILGLFIWFVAVAAAIRLAKPGSAWARRRYPESSQKRRRSQERFGPAYYARWNRLRDFVGGRPHLHG